MRRDRLLPFLVWLVTAALAAAAATLVYRAVTRPDPLAGRSDPAALYSDPALLFTDPGLLGSAIEDQVTEAVRACMARAGYDYRGPAVVAGLDTLLLPAVDGYGIAAGPAAPAPGLKRSGRLRLARCLLTQSAARPCPTLPPDGARAPNRRASRNDPRTTHPP